jgi:hypothetical protein
VSGGGKNLAPGLIFDGKNNVLETAQASLRSWVSSRINQQVWSTALTIILPITAVKVP